VIYDKPVHATCVEPQSGPPDAVNTCPTVIAQGQSLSRWFRLTVAGYRQVE
jgi:aldose 1-epimerase